MCEHCKRIADAGMSGDQAALLLVVLFRPRSIDAVIAGGVEWRQVRALVDANLVRFRMAAYPPGPRLLFRTGPGVRFVEVVRKGGGLAEYSDAELRALERDI
jgi:hypothetical protein